MKWKNPKGRGLALVSATRQGRPRGPQEVKASRIMKQSAHEVGMVASPKHQPPLIPREDLWYSIMLQAGYDPRAVVRPQRLSQWKTSRNPSGNKHATFRLVTQNPKQLRHHVPPVSVTTEAFLWQRNWQAKKISIRINNSWSRIWNVNLKKRKQAC